MFPFTRPIQFPGAVIAALELVAIVVPLSVARAQPTGNTVGVTYTSPGAQPGYTLFGPLATAHTYLINLEGELIRRWQSAYPPGASAYLLDNGHLQRTANFGAAFNAGGSGGRIEEFDWDGTLVWSFNYSTTQYRQHHDAIRLPNGNILMIAWEYKSRTEAIAAGRNPATLTQNALWPDTLVEIRPSGTSGGDIVWIWRVWDHLVQDFDSAQANYGDVAGRPELVDVNYTENGQADWMHVNGLDYNAALDQVAISVHGFDEIWVIDHGTTTAEAAGHTGGRAGMGGDLLYRWGNPRTHRAGTVADQKLFGQHNVQWIRPGLPGAGNLLIFNNGAGRPGGNYSSIEEIVPPLNTNGTYHRTPGAAYGPADAVWRYAASPTGSFFAQNISGVQRQPNGNTLICQGPVGRFFEVTPDGGRVWEYRCPVRTGSLATQGTAPPSTPVFRAERYLPDHPGLAGRDLRSLGPIELPVTYRFEFVGIERMDTGRLLSWATQPNRTYTLQFRVQDAGAAWQNVSTVTAIGNRVHVADTDPERRAAPGGLYRAFVLPFP